MNLNKAIIIGRLTRDPELKALPSGMQVCTFSVATSVSFKGKDNVRQERTEFHNIVTYGKQAENCAQYLQKGQMVAVEGRIQTRSWDKPDGTKAYRTEIVTETVQFGQRANREGVDDIPPEEGSQAPETRRRGGASPKKEPEATSGGIEYPEEDINPDDIPF